VIKAVESPFFAEWFGWLAQALRGGQGHEGAAAKLLQGATRACAGVGSMGRSPLFDTLLSFLDPATNPSLPASALPVLLLPAGRSLLVALFRRCHQGLWREFRDASTLQEVARRRITVALSQIADAVVGQCRRVHLVLGPSPLSTAAPSKRSRSSRSSDSSGVPSQEPAAPQ
jgi:hypothetical protein